MSRLSLLLTFTLTLALCSCFCAANKYSAEHKDAVPVQVNNVGPFHNPAESYTYYSLPYCSPKHETKVEANLGQSLAGDRRRTSLYDVRYLVPVSWASICRFMLTPNEIKSFRDAIKKHYIFEMFVDDLPVKGFVGEMESTSTLYEHGQHVHNETHYYLFTHLDFSIAYNEGHVIAVNLTTDPDQRVMLEYEKEVNATTAEHSLHSVSPLHITAAASDCLKSFRAQARAIVCGRGSDSAVMCGGKG